MNKIMDFSGAMERDPQRYRLLEEIAIYITELDLMRTKLAQTRLARRLPKSRFAQTKLAQIYQSGDSCISASCETIEKERASSSDEDLGSPLESDGSSGSLQAYCRICHEKEDERQLETPCACRGSIKHAHRKCIQRWCDQKENTNCEICQQPYEDTSAPLPITQVMELGLIVGSEMSSLRASLYSDVVQSRPLSLPTQVMERGLIVGSKMTRLYSDVVRGRHTK